MPLYCNSNQAKFPQPDIQNELTVIELLASRGIFPAEEHPHSERDHYRIRCPFHSDSKPSLSVHANGIAWKCWAGCGQGGPREMREMLGSGLAPRMPKPPKPAKPAVKRGESPTGCTLTQLSEAKGLPIWIMKSWGWTSYNWYGIQAIRIQYPNGSVRYRVGLTGKQRFRWAKGSPPGLYGVDRLTEEDQVVLVLEGETDVLAADLLGIRAVGVPGVSNWKPEWAKALAGKEVIVWQEPGEPAQNLVDTIAQDIPGIKVIPAPGGIKDIVELVDQAGSGAGDLLRELMAEAEPYQEEDDVTILVKGYKSLYQNRDKSLLWQSAQEYFPLPFGIKPWVHGAGLYNETSQKTVAVDFISNSWLNPANAQFKRQRLFYNILPRINGPQLYLMLVPPDDRTEQAHNAIKQRISRAIRKAGDGADLGWLWIDNALDRGHYLYVTSAPGVSGFQPFDGDVEALLVDALKAIHPPERTKDSGNFHPYGGSSNWTTKVESTGERNHGKWRLIATSKKPTDYVQLEAECIVGEIHHETTSTYWRGQFGNGLAMSMSVEDAVSMYQGQGYALTRQGRGYASEEVELERVLDG
jgi:hypothetical protein